MSVIRPMGTELEYGILEHSVVDQGMHIAPQHQNPVQLSFDVIDAVAQGYPQWRHMRWDYRGEDPVHDARGYHLERASARPDMLTDTPQLHITNTVSALGGRCYVDHAHPEYSSPEVLDPFAATAAAILGDRIMQQAVSRISDTSGRDIRLYRATTDGKGASWGSHENYQVSRQVPFEQLAQLMLAHNTSRLVLVGAGRAGVGERSEHSGFQLSQRADFMHAKLGLQTTFERPIVNTRDESHSDESMRRLHGIAGDANCMPVPNLVKLGATSMLLWLAECAYNDAVPAYSPQDMQQLLEHTVPDDPVAAMHVFSHDLTLCATVAVASGEQLTALDIQHRLIEAVHALGAIVYDGQWPDWQTHTTMQLWNQMIDDVRQVQQANDDQRLHLPQSARLEWLLKWQIMERLRRKRADSWSSATLQACDIAWGALNPEESLYRKVLQQVQTSIPVDSKYSVDYILDYADEHSIHSAVHEGLTDRARLRAALLQSLPEHVLAVSWTSAVLSDNSEQHYDLLMRSPYDTRLAEHMRAITQSTSVDDLVHNW